ncbi:MAG: hypothetical protein AAF446_09050, partial [Pseudomonadota bacterium]
LYAVRPTVPSGNACALQEEGMDCAALRLALRVILLRKMHQLALLGSNPRYGACDNNRRTLTFQASPFDHSGTSP